MPTPINIQTTQTLFFTEQVKFFDTEILKVRTRQLGAFEDFPVDTSVPSWAQEYFQTTMTQFGQAKILAKSADDIPRIDVGYARDGFHVRMLADAYAYTMQEIEAAMAAGKPLEMDRVAACRDAMMLLHNDIAWNGDVAQNLYGVLNHPHLARYTMDEPISSSATTPQDVLDTLFAYLTSMITDTGYAPNKLRMPTAAYTYLATTYRAATSDILLLDALVTSFAGFAALEVKPRWELDSSTKLVCWNDIGNEDTLMKHRIVVPDGKVFESIGEPERHNLEYTVDNIGYTGGFATKYPQEIRIGIQG